MLSQWIGIVRAARRDPHETEYDGRDVCKPSGNVIAAWIQQSAVNRPFFHPNSTFFGQASLATTDETAGFEPFKDSGEHRCTAANLPCRPSALARSLFAQAQRTAHDP